MTTTAIPSTARRSNTVIVTVTAAMKALLGIRLTVAQQQRIPEGGALFAHNLVSPLDPFIVALALRESGRSHPVIMLRDDIDRIPVLSTLLSAGALTLRAKSALDLPETVFAQATTLLGDGERLVTAPEPVMSPSLEVQPLRSGPLHVADAADVPTVPVATFGSHRLFTKYGSLRPKPFGMPVTVVIGSPLPTAAAGVDHTLRMLQLDMEGLLEQAIADYPDAPEDPSGLWWWPARRGGAAPVFGTREEQAGPAPTADLSHGAPGQDAPEAFTSMVAPAPPDTDATDGPDVAPDNGPDDASEELTDTATTADIKTMSQEDLDELLPPWEQRSPEEPAPKFIPGNRSVTTNLGVDEPVVGAGARDAIAAGREGNKPVKTFTGLSGVLAFDLPGQPRRSYPNIAVQLFGDDHIRLLGAPKVGLGHVTAQQRNGRTFFHGKTDGKLTMRSGHIELKIPAGTSATFIAVATSQ